MIGQGFERGYHTTCGQTMRIGDTLAMPHGTLTLSGFRAGNGVTEAQCSSGGGTQQRSTAEPKTKGPQNKPKAIKLKKRPRQTRACRQLRLAMLMRRSQSFYHRWP